MDPFTIAMIMGGVGSLMGGAGGLMGKGQQSPAQNMFPQAIGLGQKPPMQIPMQNQMGMQPQMMPQPNMMMPQPPPNRFSSTLGRYGGFR